MQDRPARRARHNGAFTLLELLVVVGIIGILVGVATPQYVKFKTRAQVGQAQIALRALVQANMQLRLDNGAYLPNPNAGDRNLPGDGFLSMAAGDYTPLTSPIAYLSTIPPDPFTNLLFPDAEPNLRWHYGTDPLGQISFVFESVGPDGLPNYPFASYPGRFESQNEYKWRYRNRLGQEKYWPARGRHVWELFIDNQVTSGEELRAHFTLGAAARRDPPIDDANYFDPFHGRHPKPYDPTNGVFSQGDIAFLP